MKVIVPADYKDSVRSNYEKVKAEILRAGYYKLDGHVDEYYSSPEYPDGFFVYIPGPRDILFKRFV